jgi:hypothetical protein
VTGLAVFVATTSGPVRIERITRERAPQSMVCRGRSSTVLPISDAYDSFVRLGSGVIEKTFGPFEDGAFRLDVSDTIDTGESWQLGAFIAHALSDGLLGTHETADSIVWVTGRVDCDFAVGAVGHVAEKTYASGEAIGAWLALGRSVTMIVPQGPDHEALMNAGIPSSVRIVPVKTAFDALRALKIDVPAPRRRRFSVWAAAGLAACVVVGFSLRSVPLHEEQLAVAPAPVERMEAIALQPVAEPVPIVETVAAPQVIKPEPVPSKVVLFERRPPKGHTCAEVQFGAVDAVKVPIESTAPVSESRLQGLCGLSVAVDNGAQDTYVAVVLDVISGKLLYGTSKPDLFAGQTAFGGRQEWSIDLPRRLPAPFEFRVAAISADKAIGPQADWFDSQDDAAAAAQELSSKGFSTAVVHHRVTP